MHNIDTLVFSVLFEIELSRGWQDAFRHFLSIFAWKQNRIDCFHGQILFGALSRLDSIHPYGNDVLCTHDPKIGRTVERRRCGATNSIVYVYSKRSVRRWMQRGDESYLGNRREMFTIKYWCTQCTLDTETFCLEHYVCSLSRAPLTYSSRTSIEAVKCGRAVPKMVLKVKKNMAFIEKRFQHIKWRTSSLMVGTEWRGRKKKNRNQIQSHFLCWLCWLS